MITLYLYSVTTQPNQSQVPIQSLTPATEQQSTPAGPSQQTVGQSMQSYSNGGLVANGATTEQQSSNKDAAADNESIHMTCQSISMHSQLVQSADGQHILLQTLDESAVPDWVCATINHISVRM